MFGTTFRATALIGVLGGLILPLATGCIAGDQQKFYASAVENFIPTPFTDPGAPYADPTRALGPADGRTVAVGIGGSVTLRFFTEIPNGPGADLRIFAVGPDGAEARVAVSLDGVVFREFALAAASGSGGTTEYDLDEAQLSTASFVRVRGMDDRGPDRGFDLDAVEALQ
jgi:hypothetical protein